MSEPARTESEPTRACPIDVAGQLVGVHPKTIRRWVARGYLKAEAGPRGRLVDLAEVHRLATARAYLDSARTDPDVSGSPQCAESGGLSEFIALLREKDQTIMELAGRTGWLQAKLQEAETRVQDLEQQVKLLSGPSIKDLIDSGDPEPTNNRRESSDPASTSTANHPASEQNGPNSAPCEREPRPWWRRWLGW